MAESSANLLLLFLSVLLPIWSLPDVVMNGGEMALPFDLESLGNTLICGTALVVAFHRSRGRIGGPPS